MLVKSLLKLKRIAAIPGGKTELLPVDPLENKHNTLTTFQLFLPLIYSCQREKSTKVTYSGGGGGGWFT